MRFPTLQACLFDGYGGRNPACSCLYIAYAVYRQVQPHRKTKSKGEIHMEIRTKEAIYSDIINFFGENTDVFNECIEQLDSWNGYLNDDRYYSMDELDEFFRETDPSEILCRAFYGHDADTWSKDSSGNKTYGEFNPNRDYFKYNGYGNLVSTNYLDYSNYLCKNTVEDMAENRDEIDAIDENSELSGLFDELENLEDESE